MASVNSTSALLSRQIVDTVRLRYSHVQSAKRSFLSSPDQPLDGSRQSHATLHTSRLFGAWKRVRNWQRQLLKCIAFAWLQLITLENKQGAYQGQHLWFTAGAYIRVKDALAEAAIKMCCMCCMCAAPLEQNGRRI